MKKKILALGITMSMVLAMATPALAVSPENSLQNAYTEIVEESASLPSDDTGEILEADTEEETADEQQAEEAAQPSESEASAATENADDTAEQKAETEKSEVAGDAVSDEVPAAQSAGDEFIVDSIRYRVNDEGGTCSVTGTDGEVSGDIVIPSTVNGYIVSEIASYAFYNCSGITSLSLPNTVMTINDSAFRLCQSLTSIDLSGVGVIGIYAFAYCTSLSEVHFSTKLAAIGEAAFTGCTALQEIELHENLSLVVDNAFSGCTGLEKVYYTGTEEAWNQINIWQGNDCLLNAAREYIFYDNFIRYRINGDGTCSVIGYEDDFTSYSYFAIPQTVNGMSVTSVEDEAFANCTSLCGIIVPDGITRIGNSAFSGCTQMEWILLPETLTEIGEGAFMSCVSLGAVSIPNGVKTIPKEVFKSCLYLTNIELPESLTSIGENAFEHCINLMAIDIPDTVESIGTQAFGNCRSLQSVVWPAGAKVIQENTFYQCFALTYIELPDNVEEIDGSAFCYCSSLPTIVLPESLTYIGAFAFSDCASMLSVSLPESLNYIDMLAFTGCKNLSTVNYAGDENAYNSMYINSYGNEPLLNATWNYSTQPNTCGDHAVWTLQNGELVIYGVVELVNCGKP